MSRRRAILGFMVLGCLAFLIPVGLSVLWAWNQGLDQVQARLESLSDDVLRRSRITRLQIDDAVLAMQRADASDPCAPAQLEHMRQIVADLNYLAGLGYIRENMLLCTTFAQLDAPLPLGPPHRITLSGIHAWTAVPLPVLQGARFNINSRDGYAALISPGLVLDTLPDPSVSLTHFDHAGVLVRSRGIFRRAWLAQYNGVPQHFSDGDYFITIRPADNLDTSVVAAMPIAQVHRIIGATALRLMPVGLLAGLLLSGLVYTLARRQLSLKAQLKRALKRREFFMHYQPVIDLQSGRCVGAESLIRWKRPLGPAIGPDVFIPAAEKHGLIQQVTFQVMTMVAKEGLDLFRDHPDASIAINFSADDLQSPHTEAHLQALISAADASTHNIVIEATESGFMAPEKARDVLASIRAQGFKVGIDDFGTGNSSLSYLATYDLDFLKIDKSFIAALGSDTPSSRVAFHIVEIAKTLRLKMVAEGVETQLQHDILRGAGVHLAQGWLYGRPMPMSEMLQFIRTRNVGESMTG